MAWLQVSRGRGGHMTGLSIVTNDLSGKRMALLGGAIPNLRRVALVNSHDVATLRVIAAHEKETLVPRFERLRSRSLVRSSWHLPSWRMMACKRPS
jgi:hypothetical protein